MSHELQSHINSIANNLSNPPMDEWNEGRDIESEGEFSAFDYLQDALDIEYIVNSKREYLGARILVAFGGPNIWINTRTKQVEGYWWGDSCVMSYGNDEMNIDEAVGDLWNCR